MSLSDPAAGPWHLDKRVNLALILAIMAQTGGGFWWAASINERVAMIERTQAETRGFSADLAVIKNEVSNIRRSQERLEQRLDGGKLDFRWRGETYTSRPTE